MGQAAVLAAVRHLAAPDLPGEKCVPQVLVERLIVLAGLDEIPRIPADGFLGAVTGQACEGRVDPLNRAGAIADEDGVGGRVQRGALQADGALSLPALADVADVALDHFSMVDQIDVADELHVDLPPIGGFQRQIVVADIALLLQLLEVGLVGKHVLEEPQFPDLHAEERLAGESQQLDQERIHIVDHPRFGIEDQDAVLGRLEKTAIAKLRNDQRRLHLPVVPRRQLQSRLPPAECGATPDPPGLHVVQCHCPWRGRSPGAVSINPRSAVPFRTHPEVCSSNVPAATGSSCSVEHTRPPRVPAPRWC